MFTPFSYLAEESVLTPNFFEVSLTLFKSKTAHSKTDSVVVSLMHEFTPPITPAITTGFFASAITITSSSRA